MHHLQAAGASHHDKGILRFGSTESLSCLVQASEGTFCIGLRFRGAVTKNQVNAALG